MPSFACFALLWCASLLLAQPRASLEDLAWMQGEWICAETGEVRETWHAISPRSWEGEGFKRDATSGAWLTTETLRLLQMGNTVYYLAQVPSNPLPIPFELVELKPTTARFVNPNHDFPQFLAYRLEGDQLFVEVGAIGRKSIHLHFRREETAAGR